MVSIHTHTHTHLLWFRSSFRGRLSPLVLMGNSQHVRPPQRRPFSWPHAWPVQGQCSALCPSPSEWPRVTVGAWGQIKMPASNFAPTGLSVQICPKICPLPNTQNSTTTSTHDRNTHCLQSNWAAVERCTHSDPRSFSVSHTLTIHTHAQTGLTPCNCTNTPSHGLWSILRD